MSENYIYLKKINTTAPIWLQVYTSIFRNYLFKYTGLRGVEGGVAHHPCDLQRYKKKRERQVGIKFICKLSKPCRMFYKTINNQRSSLPHSWHFNSKNWNSSSSPPVTFRKNLEQFLSKDKTFFNILLEVNSQL